ncbi:hypothetical protein ATANTOWER_019368 [Ataeniobius toweri]|uniref:Uncharacterized protein n=1 Tax=Ataeniobius toweri TaxID=208326 RepID=A0ABU7ABY7_9TELE|nr:hypothetical protein [Ataeniobius toweri]
MQTNTYNIYSFISQECAVQTLIWCLLLFCFSTESKAVYKRQVLSITSIAMAISLLGTLCMALYCFNKYDNEHRNKHVLQPISNVISVRGRIECGPLFILWVSHKQQ